MQNEHQAAIGARIASLREAQGWSQRALARWVGLDQSAVSRIEAGRRRLSADELQRFAGALHVSADELLTGGRNAGQAAPAGRPADAERPVVSFAVRLPEPPEPGLGPPADAVGPEAGPAGEAGHADHGEAGTHGWPLASSGVAEPAASRPAARAEGVRHRPARLLPSAPEATTAAGPAHLAGLPATVAEVVRDWFALRPPEESEAPVQRWNTGHSAEGRPERRPQTAGMSAAGAQPGRLLYDRVARFWRGELHVDPDDGPLPDLVPLLEDGYGAQVIVARVGAAAADALDDAPSSSDRPVAAAFVSGDVPFIFVNAARPVVLQRFALAHAFAHLVLGHGDVVDRRVEWSRNVPPEAAANDFAEELLAPVRAVRHWFERRETPRSARLDDLLELGNAFGISAWAALYRSRAAGRLQGRQFQTLRAELQEREWEVLPHQAYLGGLRDTLAHLTPEEVLPAGEYGEPAVLRLPAAMRAWALAALRSGRLSLEDAAALLRLEPDVLAGRLARLGLA